MASPSLLRAHSNLALLPSAPRLSGTASLDGRQTAGNLAAPGAHLRSAFSAPPANILPSGFVRSRSPESRPVPPKNALRLPWERLRSHPGAPREIGTRNGEANHVSESSHPYWIP